MHGRFETAVGVIIVVGRGTNPSTWRSLLFARRKTGIPIRNTTLLMPAGVLNPLPEHIIRTDSAGGPVLLLIICLVNLELGQCQRCRSPP